jgi:hypothetical protein
MAEPLEWNDFPGQQEAARMFVQQSLEEGIALRDMRVEPEALTLRQTGLRSSQPDHVNLIIIVTIIPAHRR